MKMVKDKQLLVGADFAGYPLKEVVCQHLREKGWTITDVGVTDPAVDDTDNMFHRSASASAPRSPRASSSAR